MWRKSARTPVASGRKRRGSAVLQPTKTSTMTVPGAIERGPGTGASDTPPLHAHKMRPLIEWYAVTSHRASSPEPPSNAVRFPYRTAWRSRGADLSAPKFDAHRAAPRRRASAASATPPPADPLGVGVPHPHPLRCLLPKHNLLTEGGHGPPPSLTRQQCFENRRRREAHPISAAASTPDSIPAYAAPNPRSHRNGGNARSPFF